MPVKSQNCKFCKHSKTDHEDKRIVENGIMTNHWRGPCQWSDCMCEIFESNEKHTKLIIDSKTPIIRDSTRKIFICKKCNRGFTKSKSLASHNAHCKGVMKRREENIGPL